MSDENTNVAATPSAYAYPLLIKQLLHTPRAIAAEQEIVYSDRLRMTYADMFERIGRFANLLARLGVARGETVAMMDWDSHRYLESFFAVPMYGAVLQTVNIRLSAEQVAYTLNDAGASVVLVNAEFLPLLTQIRGELRAGHEGIACARLGAIVRRRWRTGSFGVGLGLRAGVACGTAAQQQRAQPERPALGGAV